MLSLELFVFALHATDAIPSPPHPGRLRIQGVQGAFWNALCICKANEDGIG